MNSKDITELPSLLHYHTSSLQEQFEPKKEEAYIKECEILHIAVKELFIQPALLSFLTFMHLTDNLQRESLTQTIKSNAIFSFSK